MFSFSLVSFFPTFLFNMLVFCRFTAAWWFNWEHVLWPSCSVASGQILTLFVFFPKRVSWQTSAFRIPFFISDQVKCTDKRTRVLFQLFYTVQFLKLLSKCYVYLNHIKCQFLPNHVAFYHNDFVQIVHCIFSFLIFSCLYFRISINLFCYCICD